MCGGYSADDYFPFFKIGICNFFEKKTNNINLALSSLYLCLSKVIRIVDPLYIHSIDPFKISDVLLNAGL